MNAVDLHQAYKEAEDALHSLGIVADGVDTAAVNELRYAGRHILDGLIAEGEQEREEQFQRAYRHCERAVYEAYDSAIFYHFDQFDQFKDDYRMIVVSEVVSGFVDIEKTMREARGFLEEARRNSESRADYYRRAIEWYRRVSEAWGTLSAAREELNKKVDQHNEKLAQAELARQEAAKAEADAEMGRKQAIKFSVVIALVTIAVNFALGLF